MPARRQDPVDTLGALARRHKIRNVGLDPSLRPDAYDKLLCLVADAQRNLLKVQQKAVEAKSGTAKEVLLRARRYAEALWYIQLVEAELRCFQDGKFWVTEDPRLPGGTKDVEFVRAFSLPHGDKKSWLLFPIVLREHPELRAARDRMNRQRAEGGRQEVVDFNSLPLARRKALYEKDQNARLEMKRVLEDGRLSRSEKVSRLLELRKRRLSPSLRVDAGTYRAR